MESKLAEWDKHVIMIIKKNKKKAIAVNPNEWMKDGGMPTH